jgi:pimeloyl-ACP methyl ester carboxylesterase
MKRCPRCGRRYGDETLNFCLDDGSPLVSCTLSEADTQMISGAHPLGSSSGSRAFAPVEQEIKFATTKDGARIAYSVIGSGQVIVRVLGHFTHLEKEWEWPDLRHFWEQLATNFTVVRYDGRGIGLSEKYSGDFTEEKRQLDLDAVLTAIGATDVILLGISEGGWTAALYANEHPGLIDRLIFYGSYARGAKTRPGWDYEENEALVTLIRKGWGRDTPAFRQLFTSYFFPENADPGLLAHFNDMQRAAADAETAARYWRSIHERGDGTEMFAKISVPTLVIHCQDDRVVALEEGRIIAATVPGAQLVLLPSGTHYFPTERPIIDKISGAIERFAMSSKQER